MGNISDRWQGQNCVSKSLNPSCCLLSCSYWSVLRSLVGQRLPQCLRNPQTETDFFLDSGHVTGHAWCSVLTVSALLKENALFITLYHIMPVAKVQPSSRAAGTANWEFVKLTWSWTCRMGRSVSWLLSRKAWAAMKLFPQRAEWEEMILCVGERNWTEV